MLLPCGLSCTFLPSQTAGVAWIWKQELNACRPRIGGRSCVRQPSACIPEAQATLHRVYVLTVHGTCWAAVHALFAAHIAALQTDLSSA